MNLSVVTCNQPDFGILWDDLRRHSNCWSAFYTPLDLEYQSNYPQPWEPDNRSFLVRDEGGPIAGVCMSLRKLADDEFELSGFGRPILYLQHRQASTDRCYAARRKVKDVLSQTFSDQRIKTAVHRCWDAALDPVAIFLLDLGGYSVPCFFQVLDLTLDEAVLFQQVRETFRRHILYGQRELAINVVDRSCLNRQVFDEFRLLHYQAAGRETRCRASWDVNYKIVEADEAFLVLARLQGRLVSGSFFDLAFFNSCYRIGASDRTLFARPISHCVIWTGILEAKRRGARYFEMGQILHRQQPFFVGPVDPNGGDPTRCPTEKELGISNFKRGFGGHTFAGFDVWWRRAPQSA
jgi:hypothetical protein